MGLARSELLSARLLSASAAGAAVAAAATLAESILSLVQKTRHVARVDIVLKWGVGV